MEATSTHAPKAPKTPRQRGRLLTDCLSVKLQLVEDATSSGKVIVRGEFARSDAATENKRVYPQKIWEREIRRLDRALTDRKLFGELDHPNDGRTMLARVSHIVTGLKLEDGVIVGEAEIADTTKGKDLKALLQMGAKVGVSSRGYGSTRTNEDGREVVQEDYQLVTFDFVAEPADNSAYPDVFVESREHDNMDGEARTQDENAKAAEWARRLTDAKAEGAAEATASLREQLAQEVLTQIAAERDKIKEEARSEFLNDPSVAGAKRALDQVRSVLLAYILPEDVSTVVKAKDAEIAALKREVAERDLRIASLQEENEKIGDLAKEAGYKFYLERTLSGNPNAVLVRKLIGDPKQFESAASLRTKVEAVLHDLAQQQEAAKKVEEQRKQQHENALAAERELEAKNKTLEEGLTASLELNKEMAIRLYGEKCLANHPQAAKIRPILESAKLSSEQDVDNLIARFRVPTRDPEALAQTRARVRDMTRGGVSPTPLDEEAPTPSPRESGDYNGIGMSLGSLRELSGIQPKNSLANAGGR